MKRALASFMFFTRLPLWRLVDVPSHYFSRVVELWPLVGWLTGGLTACILYLASLVVSPIVAVILAFTARILLTGGLHEDGLADFCDGFGGGTSRERILAIMKDSHIGTYGVLALIIYCALWVSAVASIPVSVAVVAIFDGDTWSKFCAAQIVNFLPYARKAEEAKNKTIYSRFSIAAWSVACLIALAPAIFLPTHLCFAYIAPILTAGLLIILMRHKIGGYTGDCCGATFLLCELSFYLAVLGLL